MPESTVKIPVDPDVAIGKLDNGLTYYIRNNKKPENRVEMLLVLNAGSVLETDNQQGLAHFIEHMGFNGTKNFPKQELVEYLESIGMDFGPDLNAYTSFDETVYMLQVPTDDADKLEKGFQILSDWAYYMSFEDEEVDKERGVVVEEWRLRGGAWKRMIDKQLPIILKDSKYAQRLPIGQKAVIDTFHYDTAQNFYNAWYRPELMAVIAVGDVEKDIMDNLIKKYFSGIPKSETPVHRPSIPVPDHDETLYTIASDPELELMDDERVFQILEFLKNTSLSNYPLYLFQHHQQQ
jgi:zinc protease